MSLFDGFIQERLYLKGVSPSTIRYYRNVGTSFAPILDAPTKAGMLKVIQELIDRGISPVSVNTWLRGLKAYVRWLHEEGHIEQVFKVQFLKTEQKIIEALTPEQVARIVNGKPIGRNETRARMAALTALDTGMRFQELLNLRRTDVDFDNLCFRVHGKGNKHRLVPMSIELRKLLFRYLSQHQFDRVFSTRNGTEPTQRNLSRDFKLLCGRVGITGVRCSFHTLRHTFAVSYLRAGGNVLYLQRILGHTTLEMTNRYCRSLGIEDLKAVHSGLSLLSR